MRRTAATAVAVVLAVAVLPPLRARAKAAAVLPDALGLAVPRPLAADVTVEERDVDPLVQGDLYHPGWEAPPVVLLPGATRGGREDVRVVEAATALAAAGRRVFVPELGLYRQRLFPDDITRVRRAVAHFSDGRDSVVLFGFSYGGSLALLAAADAATSDALAQVAVFGAYYDLVGVLQAATTGVSLVGDRRIPWQADPRAKQVLLEVVSELASGRVSQEVRAAVAGDIPPDRLSSGARAFYDLLVNDDPERTADLVERLPSEVRDLLERFSPSSVAEDIRAPVIALHSTDDPAVPYGEALRLERGLPGARVLTVSVFRHVDLIAHDGAALVRALPDLWRAWRFGGVVLGRSEPLLPTLLLRAGAPAPVATGRLLAP